MMDVPHQIADQVAKLPPETQEQVLRFVSSLAASTPSGESGASLRQFAFSLDPESAREMTRAIEEDWQSTPRP